MNKSRDPGLSGNDNLPAAPNICGPSVRHLLHVTLLAPKILDNLCNPELRAFLIIEYHNIITFVSILGVFVNRKQTSFFLILPSLFFLSFVPCFSILSFCRCSSAKELS